MYFAAPHIRTNDFRDSGPFSATDSLDQRKEHKFRSQLRSWLSSAAQSWRHRWMTLYVMMVQWQIATQIWPGYGWLRPWSNQGFKRQIFDMVTYLWLSFVLWPLFCKSKFAQFCSIFKYFTFIILLFYIFCIIIIISYLL